MSHITREFLLRVLLIGAAVRIIERSLDTRLHKCILGGYRPSNQIVARKGRKLAFSRLHAILEPQWLCQVPFSLARLIGVLRVHEQSQRLIPKRCSGELAKKRCATNVFVVTLPTSLAVPTRRYRFGKLHYFCISTLRWGYRCLKPWSQRESTLGKTETCIISGLTW